MTKGECRELFLRYLDEATANGAATSAEQRADYLDKFDYFLNGALIYLAGHIKRVKEFSILHMPLKNNYAGGRGVQICQPGTRVLEGEGRACYFEVNGNVQVKIYHNGSLVYDQANIGGYNPFRRFLSHSPGRVRIELTSHFAFSVRNVAIYESTYSDLDRDVPDYGRYVSYPLPEDFREIKALVRLDGEGNYREYNRYIRQTNRVIALPYEESGEFIVRYYANPAAVPADAPDSTALDIEAKAAHLAALKVAYDASLADNPGLASWLKGIFDNELANTLTGEVEGPRSVVTVYHI